MSILLRVLLGTAVYALIIVLAAPFPAAAGLMLVFPTLNGLAFVFSPRAYVLAMTPSMLWMPVVNGVLCAAYLLAFLVLAQESQAITLAWGLLALAVALFVLVVWRPWVRVGIAHEHQLAFAIGATIAGIALVMAAPLLIGNAGGERALLAPALTFGAAGEILARNGEKIAVFALCLAVFLLVARMMPLSDGVRGILGGLPFAPFAGLVSIAADSAIDLPTRLAIVRQMAVSVWAGPAVAIWFIYGFPRVLVRLAPGSARAAAALIVAWTLCALVVAAIAAVLG